MNKKIWVGLCLGILLLSGSATAGTPSDPEILDDPTDSMIYEGRVVPHLEVTKAWIQPKGDRFEFAIELAGLPDLEDIPKDAVYVWHYTWSSMRLYWRANWTADHSEFQFFGGAYQGCKPPFGESHDLERNRRYCYIPGNKSQSERIQGFVSSGSPGRIGWTYPLDAYGENRAGLRFTGLFVATYRSVPASEEGGNDLRYIDIARAPPDVDYNHRIASPWWAKFTPGPSPFLLVSAAAVLGGIVRGRIRSEK